MEQKRILLVSVPRMLSDIIRGLVWAAPDLSIVAECSNDDAALQAIEKSRAELVITTFEGSARTNVERLFGERGALRVLAISANGHEGCLYEFRRSERMLADVSPQSLLAAIRNELRNDTAPAARSASPC